jgi:hypothetical protein
LLINLTPPGPENELMPAQADNPDGFWEHVGFVAVNDQLLNELGGAWDLPPKANENFMHVRLNPLRLKAQLLIQGFDFASVWGWKDPADEPEDFARALLELYESEELWSRLSENGLKKTRALYSTDAAREKLEFLLSDRHLKSLVQGL